MFAKRGRPIAENSDDRQSQETPDVQASTDEERLSALNGGPAPLAGPLRPLVDLAARIDVGVQAKLLSGVLVGALLLLGMGILSLIVIERMSNRVETLNRVEERVDRGRQMEYAVTAQSHFRSMALLTNDDSNNEKIAKAKVGFLDNLVAVEAMALPTQDTFFDEVREANDRFRVSSENVLGLYDVSKASRAEQMEAFDDQALWAHLLEEHPISHELEAQMGQLIGEAAAAVMEANDDFQSDKRFLRAMVWTFSGVSLVFALLVGFVLSAAFIRPVRRIESVVAGVVRGGFTRRGDVPNRDEFGALSANVNRMTQRLGNLYDDMQIELAERQRAEDELRRRAVELVAVNSELESISYSLSHDLAAPLQNLDVSSMALLEDHVDTLGADGRSHVQRVRGASERMGQLVNDMVSMSRVLTLGAPELGEISRETVDLTSMAHTLADQLRDRDSGRQVEFVIAEGLTADGDPNRL